MIDFKWNRADDDLSIEGDIVLLDEGLSLAQRVELSVRLLKGTWFLNVENGTDWAMLFANNNKGLFDSVIRSAIMDIEGVGGIVSYSSRIVNNISLHIEVTVRDDKTNQTTLVKIEV